MNVQIAIALIDLVVVIVLIVRRVEVRLVLLAAAVPVFAVSGGLNMMLAKLVGKGAAGVGPVRFPKNGRKNPAPSLR